MLAWLNLEPCSCLKHYILTGNSSNLKSNVCYSTFDNDRTYGLFTCGQVFLKDTDERACAYIAGPAPNRWGLNVDGVDLFKSISEISVSPGEIFTF